MGQLLYEMSWKYHFMFASANALCKWGWIFHRELHSVTPAAFLRNFLPARNNPNPKPWPFEPKINRRRQTDEDYYWAKFKVLSHFNRRFSFYCAIIHAHTTHTHLSTHPHIYTPTHIVTKWLPYPHHHTTLLAQILTYKIDHHESVSTSLWHFQTARKTSVY